VPQDKNQAEAVREIVNLAAANGVTLASITFPTSSLGTTVAGPWYYCRLTPAPAATTPVASSSQNANLTQLTPVKDIPGCMIYL